MKGSNDIKMTLTLEDHSLFAIMYELKTVGFSIYVKESTSIFRYIILYSHSSKKSGQMRISRGDVIRGLERGLV